MDWESILGFALFGFATGFAPSVMQEAKTRAYHSYVFRHKWRDIETLFWWSMVYIIWPLLWILAFWLFWGAS